ncbi:hypothetical protein RUM43_005302 [Polyplax serrata]|uniref:Uncharacterized protein n=1 Tax=Polyplax serrata TaxID=468196 RepID=A0AAN8PWR7_POLSC
MTTLLRNKTYEKEKVLNLKSKNGIKLRDILKVKSNKTKVWKTQEGQKPPGSANQTDPDFL